LLKLLEEKIEKEKQSAIHKAKKNYRRTSGDDDNETGY